MRCSKSADWGHSKVPVLPITFGRAVGQPADALPRHRHATANLAVVLSGSYVEVGDHGRHVVGAGDVLIHDAFEAHLNRFLSPRTEVLSLPLRFDHALPVRGRVLDPDEIVRVAERDLTEALLLLLAKLEPLDRHIESAWPDMLAASLRENPNLSICAWAREFALAPSTVSRGFRLAYGTSARRFRAECRARGAWKAITSGNQPLATIAADHGYCDQQHMNRAISQLTGHPPGAWRRRVNSVQD